jgi:hypothetical protein
MREERSGEKWREVERSGEKWREVERSGEVEKRGKGEGERRREKERGEEGEKKERGEMREGEERSSSLHLHPTIFPSLPSFKLANCSFLLSLSLSSPLSPLPSPLSPLSLPSLLVLFPLSSYLLSPLLSSLSCPPSFLPGN